MWGWSVIDFLPRLQVPVFPTYVGMVRRQGGRRERRNRFPHVCGDGPSEWGADYESNLFSPRMWGWSVKGYDAVWKRLVFPTYVGMVRTIRTAGLRRARFPHVCGDGPSVQIDITSQSSFSPRMWGWSECELVKPYITAVFPTYVGMVRSQVHWLHSVTRFPRA